MRFALSFLTEVGQTKRLGRLILALFAQRDHDQHDQRDDIRQHLVKLLDGEVGAAGNEDVQNVAAAEENGGQNAHVRTPDREDDQRDGEPAAVAEGVVRPDAAGVVHDVIQAAESGDHAADAGRGCA